MLYWKTRRNLLEISEMNTLRIWHWAYHQLVYVVVRSHQNRSRQQDCLHVP